MSNEYTVYILENDSSRHYIGLSENVTQRLSQHNEGKSKWTAKHGPWKLIWTSRQMTLSDARKLENKLKRQKGGSGLHTLMNEFSS